MSGSKLGGLYMLTIIILELFQFGFLYAPSYQKIGLQLKIPVYMQENNTLWMIPNSFFLYKSGIRSTNYGS